MNSTRRIQIFIGFMAAAGLGLSSYSAIRSHGLHLYFALTVLILAAVTSRMRVKLPGINGNMSMNLPFLLVAIANLSAAEAVVITLISTLVQCWPKRNARLNPAQMIFNLSMMTFATCLASGAYALAGWQAQSWSLPLALALATAAMLLGQTLPVAGVVAITESKPVASVWRNIWQLSFPYYVLSAGIVAMLQMVGSRMGWPLALAVFPVMYGIHASYRFYFAKIAESTPAPVLVRAAHA